MSSRSERCIKENERLVTQPAESIRQITANKQGKTLIQLSERPTDSEVVT